jgi:hypothetical protein
MATGDPHTTGETLADQFFAALHGAANAPVAGARDLPVLEGLMRSGGFHEPQENVLAKAIELLRSGNRVFTYGSSVVLEYPQFGGQGRQLVTLRNGASIERGAECWLGNLFVCENDDNQFPPPRWFVELLLTTEPLLHNLPRINIYTQRPLFDTDFVLHNPGFDAHSGIMVHGPAIEPFLTPPINTSSAIDRLPLHLRTLLRDFCFATDADVANTLGLFITGLLINHFIDPGKPIALIDGNQPNTGKTWLVRALGLVLDGVEPATMFYTAVEEELQKRVGAKLRESVSSVLLLDNAKTAGGAEISSPFIESTSVSPEISIRILGQSVMYTRPNNVLWAITMNKTHGSADLISRGLPIRLYYEGRAENREFAGRDPVDYARRHRIEILGELAGMVVYWNQQARPSGTRPHRLRHWASVVGGIVELAGFPEFLTNAQEAAAAFNSAADELAALAEVVVVDANGPFIVEP